MGILKYQPFFLGQAYLLFDLEGLDLGLAVDGVADIILIAEDGTYRGALPSIRIGDINTAVNVSVLLIEILSGRDDLIVL